MRSDPGKAWQENRGDGEAPDNGNTADQAVVWGTRGWKLWAATGGVSVLLPGLGSSSQGGSGWRTGTNTTRQFYCILRNVYVSYLNVLIKLRTDPGLISDLSLKSGLYDHKSSETLDIPSSTSWPIWIVLLNQISSMISTCPTLLV